MVLRIQFKPFILFTCMLVLFREATCQHQQFGPAQQFGGFGRPAQQLGGFDGPGSQYGGWNPTNDVLNSLSTPKPQSAQGPQLQSPELQGPMGPQSGGPPPVGGSASYIDPQSFFMGASPSQFGSQNPAFAMQLQSQSAQLVQHQQSSQMQSQPGMVQGSPSGDNQPYNSGYTAGYSAAYAAAYSLAYAAGFHDAFASCQQSKTNVNNNLSSTTSPSQPMTLPQVASPPSVQVAPAQVMASPAQVDLAARGIMKRRFLYHH